MSNSRNIDLIVTDLGGTLVKTDEAIMAAVRRAAGQLQIPEGYADPVYDVFGTSIWEYVHAYLPEGHKDRTNDCHQRFWELFPYEVLDQITPFAGVEEALHDLKRRGVRLAVLSGLRLEAIESILSGPDFQRLGRGPLFHAVLGRRGRLPGHRHHGPGQGVRRPAPDRTIYIGDTDHDVRQAKKAGVVSAVVKTGGQAIKYLHKIQAQNPHYLLDSFAGLCDMVGE